MNITGVPVNDFVSTPLVCPSQPPSDCCSTKVTNEKEI